MEVTISSNSLYLSIRCFFIETKLGINPLPAPSNSKKNGPKTLLGKGTIDILDIVVLFEHLDELQTFFGLRLVQGLGYGRNIR